MEPILHVKAHDILHREKFIWEKASYDNWFLIIPCRGRYTCTMQGKEQLINPWDLHFYPPGIEFSRKIIEPLTLHYIQFEWNCSEEELKKTGRYPIGKYSVAGRERLKDTCSMLEKISLTYDVRQKYWREHLIRDIWVQFCMERSLPDTGISVFQDSLMQRAREKMEQDFSGNLSIAEIAYFCGLSHSGFTRRFQEAAGMSPVDFLTSLRINKAKTLLNETNLTVSEISELCGYENQFYFSKRFREVIGVSPREYRKNLIV